MNGPGTDSLTIRHTSATVPGGARPGWGLPHKQLPAATRRDLTPESALQQEIQTGQRAIQDKYALQWKEINRSRRFIGATKTKQMLRQIDTKAKQEMLQFNQQAQQQLAQLQDVDRLAEHGMITNPDEIKARMTFGADVAKSMYPTPGKEPSIPEQFGKLDVYSHRISQELENFQIVGGGAPSKPLKPSDVLKYGPLAIGPIAAYRGLKRKKEPELQIWDPTIPTKDPETDEDIMGKWRKAEPAEIKIHKAWLQEEKDVAARKRELLGQPDITHRRTGTTRSGFDAGITGSVRPQRTSTRQLKDSDPLGLR
jgi:hypothetical protein